MPHYFPNKRILGLVEEYKEGQQVDEEKSSHNETFVSVDVTRKTGRRVEGTRGRSLQEHVTALARYLAQRRKEQEGDKLTTPRAEIAIHTVSPYKVIQVSNLPRHSQVHVEENKEESEQLEEEEQAKIYEEIEEEMREIPHPLHARVNKTKHLSDLLRLLRAYKNRKPPKNSKLQRPSQDKKFIKILKVPTISFVKMDDLVPFPQGTEMRSTGFATITQPKEISEEKEFAPSTTDTFSTGRDKNYFYTNSLQDPQRNNYIGNNLPPVETNNYQIEETETKNNLPYGIRTFPSAPFPLTPVRPYAARPIYPYFQQENLINFKPTTPIFRDPRFLPSLELTATSVDSRNKERVEMPFRQPRISEGYYPAEPEVGNPIQYNIRYYPKINYYDQYEAQYPSKPLFGMMPQIPLNDAYTSTGQEKTPFAAYPGGFYRLRDPNAYPQIEGLRQRYGSLQGEIGTGAETMISPLKESGVKNDYNFQERIENPMPAFFSKLENRDQAKTRMISKNPEEYSGARIKWKSSPSVAPEEFRKEIKEYQYQPVNPQKIFLPIRNRIITKSSKNKKLRISGMMSPNVKKLRSLFLDKFKENFEKQIPLPVPSIASVIKIGDKLSKSEITSSPRNHFSRKFHKNAGRSPLDQYEELNSRTRRPITLYNKSEEMKESISPFNTETPLQVPPSTKGKDLDEKTLLEASIYSDYLKRHLRNERKPFGKKLAALHQNLQLSYPRSRLRQITSLDTPRTYARNAVPLTELYHPSSKIFMEDTEPGILVHKAGIRGLRDLQVPLQRINNKITIFQQKANKLSSAQHNRLSYKRRKLIAKNVNKRDSRETAGGVSPSEVNKMRYKAEKLYNRQRLLRPAVQMSTEYENQKTPFPNIYKSNQRLDLSKTLKARYLQPTISTLEQKSISIFAKEPNVRQKPITSKEKKVQHLHSKKVNSPLPALGDRRLGGQPRISEMKEVERNQKVATNFLHDNGRAKIRRGVSNTPYLLPTRPTYLYASDSLPRKGVQAQIMSPIMTYAQQQTLLKQPLQKSYTEEEGLTHPSKIQIAADQERIKRQKAGNITTDKVSAELPSIQQMTFPQSANQEWTTGQYEKRRNKPWKVQIAAHYGVPPQVKVETPALRTEQRKKPTVWSNYVGGPKSFETAEYIGNLATLSKQGAETLPGSRTTNYSPYTSYSTTPVSNLSKEKKNNENRSLYPVSREEVPAMQRLYELYRPWNGSNYYHYYGAGVPYTYQNIQYTKPSVEYLDQKGKQIGNINARFFGSPVSQVAIDKAVMSGQAKGRQEIPYDLNTGRYPKINKLVHQQSQVQFSLPQYPTIWSLSADLWKNREPEELEKFKSTANLSVSRKLPNTGQKRLIFDGNQKESIAAQRNWHDVSKVTDGTAGEKAQNLGGKANSGYNFFRYTHSTKSNHIYSQPRNTKLTVRKQELSASIPRRIGFVQKPRYRQYFLPVSPFEAAQHYNEAKVTGKRLVPTKMHFTPSQNVDRTTEVIRNPDFSDYDAIRKKVFNVRNQKTLQLTPASELGSHYKRNFDSKIKSKFLSNSTLIAAQKIAKLLRVLPKKILIPYRKYKVGSHQSRKEMSFFDKTSESPRNQQISTSPDLIIQHLKTANDVLPGESDRKNKKAAKLWGGSVYRAVPNRTFLSYTVPQKVPKARMIERFKKLWSVEYGINSADDNAQIPLRRRILNRSFFQKPVQKIFCGLNNGSAASKIYFSNESSQDKQSAFDSKISDLRRTRKTMMPTVGIKKGQEKQQASANTAFHRNLKNMRRRLFRWNLHEARESPFYLGNINKVRLKEKAAEKAAGTYVQQAILRNGPLITQAPFRYSRLSQTQTVEKAKLLKNKVNQRKKIHVWKKKRNKKISSIRRIREKETLRTFMARNTNLEHPVRDLANRRRVQSFGAIKILKNLRMGLPTGYYSTRQGLTGMNLFSLSKRRKEKSNLHIKKNQHAYSSVYQSSSTGYLRRRSAQDQSVARQNYYHVTRSNKFKMKSSEQQMQRSRLLSSNTFGKSEGEKTFKKNFRQAEMRKDYQSLKKLLSTYTDVSNEFLDDDSLNTLASAALEKYSDAKISKRRAERKLSIYTRKKAEFWNVTKESELSKKEVISQLEKDFQLISKAVLQRGVSSRKSLQKTMRKATERQIRDNIRKQTMKKEAEKQVVKKKIKKWKMKNTEKRLFRTQVQQKQLHMQENAFKKNIARIALEQLSKRNTWQSTVENRRENKARRTSTRKMEMMRRYMEHQRTSKEVKGQIMRNKVEKWMIKKKSGALITKKVMKQIIEKVEQQLVRKEVEEQLMKKSMERSTMKNKIGKQVMKKEMKERKITTKMQMRATRVKMERQLAQKNTQKEIIKEKTKELRISKAEQRMISKAIKKQIMKKKTVEQMTLRKMEEETVRKRTEDQIANKNIRATMRNMAQQMNRRKIEKQIKRKIEEQLMKKEKEERLMRNLWGRAIKRTTERRIIKKVKEEMKIKKKTEKQLTKRGREEQITRKEMKEQVTQKKMGQQILKLRMDKQMTKRKSEEQWIRKKTEERVKRRLEAKKIKKKEKILEKKFEKQLTRRKIEELITGNKGQIIRDRVEEQILKKKTQEQTTRNLRKQVMWWKVENQIIKGKVGKQLKRKTVEKEVMRGEMEKEAIKNKKESTFRKYIEEQMINGEVKERLLRRRMEKQIVRKTMHKINRKNKKMQRIKSKLKEEIIKRKVEEQMVRKKLEKRVVMNMKEKMVRREMEKRILKWKVMEQIIIKEIREQLMRKKEEEEVIRRRILELITRNRMEEKILRRKMEEQILKKKVEEQVIWKKVVEQMMRNRREEQMMRKKIERQVLTTMGEETIRREMERRVLKWKIKEQVMRNEIREQLMRKKEEEEMVRRRIMELIMRKRKEEQIFIKNMEEQIKKKKLEEQVIRKRMLEQIMKSKFVEQVMRKKMEKWMLTETEEEMIRKKLNTRTLKWKMKEHLMKKKIEGQLMNRKKKEEEMIRRMEKQVMRKMKEEAMSRKVKVQIIKEKLEDQVIWKKMADQMMKKWMEEKIATKMLEKMKEQMIRKNIERRIIKWKLVEQMIMKDIREQLMIKKREEEVIRRRILELITRNRMEEKILRRKMEEQILKKKIEEQVIWKNAVEQMMRNRVEEQLTKKRMEKQVVKTMEGEIIKREMERRVVKWKIKEQMIRNEIREQLMRKKEEEEMVRRRIMELIMRKRREEQILRKNMEEQLKKKKLEEQVIQKRMLEQIMKSKLVEQVMRKKMEKRMLTETEEEIIRKKLDTGTLEWKMEEQLIKKKKEGQLMRRKKKEEEMRRRMEKLVMRKMKEEMMSRKVKVQMMKEKLEDQLIWKKMVDHMMKKWIRKKTATKMGKRILEKMKEQIIREKTKKHMFKWEMKKQMMRKKIREELVRGKKEKEVSKRKIIELIIRSIKKKKALRRKIKVQLMKKRVGEQITKMNMQKRIVGRVEEKLTRREMEKHILKKEMEEQILKRRMEMRNKKEEELIRRMKKELTETAEKEKEMMRKKTEDQTMERKVDKLMIGNEMEEQVRRSKLEERMMRKRLEEQLMKRKLEEEVMRARARKQIFRMQASAQRSFKSSQQLASNIAKISRRRSESQEQLLDHSMSLAEAGSTSQVSAFRNSTWKN